MKAFATAHVVLFAILAVKCGWWAPLFTAFALMWVLVFRSDPAPEQKQPKLGNCTVCAFSGETVPATIEAVTAYGDVRRLCSTCAKANELIRDAAEQLNHGTAFSA